MKGMLLSLLLFPAYVLVFIVLVHLLKPQRHVRVFLPLALLFTPLHFLLYAVTPPDLGCLREAWLASPAWFDASVGWMVLMLNIHSFIDYFFGFNGGFSTSMMLNLYRAGEQGLTSRELVRRYTAEDGRDKIMAWRLPRLEQTGYIRIDPVSSACVLTPKGLRVARLSRGLKRILNLEAGG